MSFPQVQPWSQLLPLPPTRSSDQHPHYNDNDDYDDDMIQEFFSITTTTAPNDDASTDDDAATANNNDVSVDWLLWTTLPARLHRLVRRIQHQHQHHQPQQQQQQQVISRVTASLLSYVPPSTSSSSASSSMWLPSLFQTFFTAALGYHIFTHNDATTTTTTTSDGTTEEDPLSAVLLSVLFENPSPTTTTTNNNRRGPDWKTILEQVFHSQQQQQQEEGHTLLVLFYHHLRQLEWLPSSAASVASSLSWSDSIASTTTTNNNNTTWILQDALFQYAVPNLIQTLIKSIILGNYDTDTYDNDTEDTTTTTTTTSATTLLTTILHWTDRMIVPWLSRDVFGIIDDDPPPHPSSSSLLLLANQLKDYVHRTVYQSYWSVRLSEIFDMVTSYPESLPAIQELKHVLWHVPSSSSTSSSSSPRQIDHSDITVRIDELSSALRNSFVVRLNHPGANTTQMIDIYIAAVQVLRVLLWQRPQAPTHESSSSFTISSKHMNTIVAHITEPVRSYLRHYRNDTVRCILTSLTSTTTTPTSTTTTTGSSSATISNHHHHHNASNDDVPHSADASSGGSTSHHVLYQELRRQDTKPLEYMTMNSDDEDDDEEECPTMDWQPRPSIYQSHTRQAPLVEPRPPPTYTSRSSTNNQDANSDILAMLVGIYGSKELFVNEYRSMLADKLLGSHYDHENNTDQDIHTLELLKLRFGEMSLINAEVMIKDIEDSARINKNIRDAYRTKKMSTSSNGVTADAAIVSHIFWPKLQDSSFKHHPRIQILLDEYATIYAEQKNPRTLQWYNHLGSIQLELDYYVEEQRYDATDTLRRTGRTKEFTCSPLLATLISHFEDEPIWTTEQLSNETNLPDHIIVKQMTFWVTQRVVLLQAPVGTMSSVDPSHMVYKLAFPFVHDGI